MAKKQKKEENEGLLNPLRMADGFVKKVGVNKKGKKLTDMFGW
jgi:hypothetical protein